MRRRVVITGLGCVTPLGDNVESTWTSLKNGKSGVDFITLFPTDGMPTKISAEVRNWDISRVGEDPHRWSFAGRHTQFAVGAAKQAFLDAGLDRATINPLRFGIYLGSGEGTQDFDRLSRMMEAAVSRDPLDVTEFTRAGLEILQPDREFEPEPPAVTGHLAELFNAKGPNGTCLTACAASNQAVGEAIEIIRSGEADLILAGGAHSMIHVLAVSGFSLLGALSTESEHPASASRPFDRHRNGFVLGEGASIVVLEEWEHARSRRAPVLAEMLGYGVTADAYHVTDMHPQGRGAEHCMKLALADAGLNPDQVHYINAHGTSTLANDRIETMAIKRVFGPLAYRIPVSSTKSMMGHLVAAAGATELIACAMAIRDNVLPPTINYQTPDPDCDLDYVPNQARECRCDVALNNNFGFGGQNVSLVIGRISGG